MPGMSSFPSLYTRALVPLTWYCSVSASTSLVSASASAGSAHRGVGNRGNRVIVGAGVVRAANNAASTEPVPVVANNDGSEYTVPPPREPPAEIKEEKKPTPQFDCGCT